jgi:hypothetical protein
MKAASRIRAFRIKAIPQFVQLSMAVRATPPGAVRTGPQTKEKGPPKRAFSMTA